MVGVHRMLEGDLISGGLALAGDKIVLMTYTRACADAITRWSPA